MKVTSRCFILYGKDFPILERNPNNHIMAWEHIAAIGTVSLVFIDLTADKSSQINSIN